MDPGIQDLDTAPTLALVGRLKGPNGDDRRHDRKMRGGGEGC